MKKFLIIFGLVLGFASAVYADGHFCCGGGKTKEQCCAEKGKIYCPSDETCRTRCPDVTPPDCIGGCINPEGVCCTWCPSAEVCQRMGKCQQIVDGCYDCVTCLVPNPCPVPQCLNEEGQCCDSCPRVCPEGECLINVDGCYQCGECGECNPACTGGMVCCGGRCQTPVTSCEGCREPTVDGCGCGKDQTTKKQTGKCCDEGEVPCCPLLEGTCECVLNAEICEETEPTEPSEPTEPTGTDTGGGGTTPDGECGCGWFCSLLNEETVQPVANATVDTPLQHGITRDFSDCGRCVNWMFENRIVCQCNDGYTQVDIEGEDLDICCPTVNVCGEAENKVCCEDGEVCAEDKCCPEIKACGMGVDRVCCGEMEECVGDVCCLAEKKCGDSCCSAEQECVEGECKCPEDKPNLCGDTCCEHCDGNECAEPCVTSAGQNGYLVTNYVGSTTSGKVCCEVKADEEGYYDDGAYSGPWKRTYGVSGAIDGKCCGGETSYTVSRERWWGDGDCLETVERSNTYSYAVLSNKEYYCAKSKSEFYENGGDERCSVMYSYHDTASYPNPSTYITVSKERHGAGEEMYLVGETCRYSNSGDPQYGSPCN